MENRQTDHDANGDGFLDMPKLKQYSLMNRWAYVTPGFISQLYVSMLSDERTSGMTSRKSDALRHKLVRKSLIEGNRPIGLRFRT